MAFKNRFCSFPCLVPDPSGDGNYISQDREINPLRISAYWADKFTWVNKKNVPVYEDVAILRADGKEYMVLATLEETLSVIELFMM